jgi:hypothetical protein
VRRNKAEIAAHHGLRLLLLGGVAVLAYFVLSLFDHGAHADAGGRDQIGSADPVTAGVRLAVDATKAIPEPRSTAPKVTPGRPESPAAHTATQPPSRRHATTNRTPAAGDHRTAPPKAGERNPSSAPEKATNRRTAPSNHSARPKTPVTPAGQAPARRPSSPDLPQTHRSVDASALPGPPARLARPESPRSQVTDVPVPSRRPRLAKLPIPPTVASPQRGLSQPPPPAQMLAPALQPLTELPVPSALPPLTQLPVLSQLPPLNELPALSQLPPLTQLPVVNQLPALTGLPVLSQLLPPLTGVPAPALPPALSQTPALPAPPRFAATPQPSPAAGLPAEPTSLQALGGAAIGPHELAGPAIIRSVPPSRARPKATPAPLRPPVPEPQPFDRPGTTDRSSESAGHSSPALGTIPSSWLPEPLAWGPALAADPSAARGRATRYTGPPS